ncbi:MAG TPA: glycosyltransferase family 4 protein [Pyrinomonadaceae bacterium]|nr:glycosyltransferase family 4 protein [Pyrinomonadaceae bacterium]
MKIVFYNHTGKVSGAERLLLNASRRLDGVEFDRVMVCPADGPLADLAGEAGMTVHTVANLEARFTWRPGAFLRYGKSFVRVISDFRQKIIELNPDLIHANSIRAGLVATGATMGLKMKVVWHLHDLLPRHPLSSAIRMVAARSKRSRMIAVSQAVRRNFCGLLSPSLHNRITVILNAIDLKNFSAVGNDREEIRNGLLLENGDFAIGIVGQLTPRKGQMELLEAFEKLLRKVPRAVLVIAGAAIFNRDGEYEELLRSMALRLGISHRVRMLGARQDVPEIMRALDLLVVNSRREPFGLVACEAMAVGTPVLATACDGLPEIIDHRRNGWLVPFGDQQTLVDALSFLAERPEVRSELAGVAREDVAKRFALERYMNELQAFYREQARQADRGATVPVATTAASETLALQ